MESERKSDLNPAAAPEPASTGTAGPSASNSAVPTGAAAAPRAPTGPGAGPATAPSAPAAPTPVAPAPAAVTAAPATPRAAVAPAPAPPPPPPPPPVPAALAQVALPFQGVDYSAKGYHAEASVAPDEVVGAAARLDREGFSLDTITGVDWLAQGQMEVVYDYFHPNKCLRAVVRTRVTREKPEVPTISQVFPGANWHERETHDFLGIRFTGHPDLSPFLLPEDATYHPLRKDFTSC